MASVFIAPVELVKPTANHKRVDISRAKLFVVIITKFNDSLLKAFKINRSPSAIQQPNMPEWFVHFVEGIWGGHTQYPVAFQQRQTLFRKTNMRGGGKVLKD